MAASCFDSSELERQVTKTVSERFQHHDQKNESNFYMAKSILKQS